MSHPLNVLVKFSTLLCCKCDNKRANIYNLQGGRDLLATLDRERMNREKGEKEERERDSCLIHHFILQLTTTTPFCYIYQQF